MPLSSEEDLRDVRDRVMRMFIETLDIFKMIEKNADEIYEEKAPAVKAAIKEYFDDFLINTNRSGQKHPEELIYKTSAKRFQNAGLYGAQLALKEKQVKEANKNIKNKAKEGKWKFWKKPFQKWIDVINNFLGSLASATGISEAIKELKDCLRDELPDEQDQE